MIHVSMYIPYGVLWSKDHNFIKDGVIYSPLLDYKELIIDPEKHKQLNDEFKKVTDSMLSENSLDYHLSLQIASLERMIGEKDEKKLSTIDDLLAIGANRFNQSMDGNPQYTFASIPYGFISPSTVRLYSIGKMVYLMIADNGKKTINDLKDIQRKLKYAWGIVSVISVDNDPNKAQIINDTLAKERLYHPFDSTFVKRNPYEFKTSKLSET